MAFSTETRILIHVLPHIYVEIIKFYLNPRWPNGLVVVHLIRGTRISILPETDFFSLLFSELEIVKVVYFFFAFVKIRCILLKSLQYCVTVSISYSRVGSQEPLITRKIYKEAIRIVSQRVCEIFVPLGHQ